MTMDTAREDRLLTYYQQELDYLRQMGALFARRYPSLAARLDLTEMPTTDPHVERLLEGFAFLAGHIQYNLVQEAAEIPAALLELLYPHLQELIPSMTIAQFRLDPNRAAQALGFQIPAQTELFTATQPAPICRFRTAYPVMLWPVQVTQAQLIRTARQELLLGLRLQTLGGVEPHTLTLDRLRFHLHGSSSQINLLYELLFCHAQSVYLLPAGPAALRQETTDLTPVHQLASGALRPVGLDREEALLPLPAASNPAYRLLQEYFCFPEKFHFFEVAGIDLARLGPAMPHGFEIYISFDPQRTAPLTAAIEQARRQINAQTFQLGCTPAINLFRQTSEPIRLDHQRHEYLLVPDARLQDVTEIYAIEQVVAVDVPRGETTTLAPLLGLTHADERRNQRAFWQARRLPASQPGLDGTETWLSFTDLAFNPHLPSQPTVFAHTLCTNRGLASQLAVGTRLQMDQPAPLSGIVCLDRPTPQRMPPPRGESLWRLVSQLSLNHLSLEQGVCFTLGQDLRTDLDKRHDSPALRAAFVHNGVRLSQQVRVRPEQHAPDNTRWLIEDSLSGRTYTVTVAHGGLLVTSDQESLVALQALLRLHIPTDNLAALAQIAQLQALTCRRLVRRIACDPWGSVARGLEITLTLGDDASHSNFLLAAVLSRFFSLYVSANLFTQLVAETARVKGTWNRWPPMAGGKPLL